MATINWSLSGFETVTIQPKLAPAAAAHGYRRCSYRGLAATAGLGFVMLRARSACGAPTCNDPAVLGDEKQSLHHRLKPLTQGVCASREGHLPLGAGRKGRIMVALPTAGPANQARWVVWTLV